MCGTESCGPTVRCAGSGTAPGEGAEIEILLPRHIGEVASGSEALEMIEQHPETALLYTDVIMPGRMSGPQLAVLATQRHPELKVLFTSGYGEQAKLTQAGGTQEALGRPAARCN